MPVLEFGLFEQAEKSSPVHLLFRTPLRERAVQAVLCGVADRHAVGGQTIEKYEERAMRRNCCANWHSPDNAHSEANGESPLSAARFVN